MAKGYVPARRRLSDRELLAYKEAVGAYLNASARFAGALHVFEQVSEAGPGDEIGSDAFKSWRFIINASSAITQEVVQLMESGLAAIDGVTHFLTRPEQPNETPYSVRDDAPLVAELAKALNRAAWEIEAIADQLMAAALVEVHHCRQPLADLKAAIRLLEDESASLLDDD